jgi:thymidylate synthase
MEHLSKTQFDSSNAAFEYLYEQINILGINFDDTKALFNVGFYIKDPTNNLIVSDIRGWNLQYAKSEWEWYCSKDKNAYKIAELGKIWYNHMDSNGNVNSNYGYQWSQANQLNTIIDKLKEKNNTRQAWITIYDGKQINNSTATNNGYKTDTPCTLNVGFSIINNKLCMSVLMRSNDLWYGFCNDQFCFTNLQQLIAKELNLELGWYYHYAHNMHVYNNKLNKNGSK